MRELLFRGKKEKNGEWIEGIAFPHDNRGKVTMFRQHPADGSLIGDEVIPESVGQYTGLMDENGTKIFEGDILKDRLDGDISEVIYTGYAFKVKNVKRKYILTLAGYHNCEVIGNIYDNPELLEVNNE